MPPTGGIVNTAPPSSPLSPPPQKSDFASVVAEVMQAASTAPAAPTPALSLPAARNQPTHTTERQWSTSRIDLAQKIWGLGFCRPGGPDFTHQQLQHFASLATGGNLLDANADLGGALQVAVENFPVAASGLVANATLLSSARAQLAKSGAQIVPLRQPQPAEVELPAQEHDYIFLRDGLWAAQGKPRLLTHYCHSLTDTGQMLLIDIMPPDGTEDSALRAWLDKHGITNQLWSAATIEKFIRTQPDMECAQQADLTAAYIDLITQGWRNFLPNLVAQKSTKDFQHLVLAEVVYWAELVGYLASGQLTYRRLHFRRKPPVESKT